MLPVGWSAAMVELDSTDAVGVTYRQLAALRAAGTLPAGTELVPAARTVLVQLPAPAPMPDLAALLAGAERSGGATGEPGRPVDPAGATIQPVDPVDATIPVRYDGPDLDEVAQLSGLHPDEVVRRHSTATFTVAFCGFAPGFAYLTGLPGRLHVPRRGTPRTAVEAGSVAIASEFTGIYPRRSPGGWRVIGHTDEVLWDPAREPPALLTPGTQVRITVAGP